MFGLDGSSDAMSHLRELSASRMFAASWVRPETGAFATVLGEQTRDVWQSAGGADSAAVIMEAQLDFILYKYKSSCDDTHCMCVFSKFEY